MDDCMTKNELRLSKLMAGNLMPFSEMLALETNEDFIYLSDPDTYELYMISAPDPAMIFASWGDYKGKKCYEVLQNRDSPCPFCTNKLLTKNGFYVWRYYNPLAKREYMLKDKLVSWNDKLVRMEVVMDISSTERLNQVMDSSIERQNVMMKCMYPLIYEGDFNTALFKLLESICLFFKAEWGHIEYFDGDQEQIWWSEDLKRRNTVLTNPTDAAVLRWSQLLSDNTQAAIMDVESVRVKDPDSYEFLVSYGVRSSCITPLFVSGRLMGMIVVNNIRQRWSYLSMISVLAAYVAGIMQKEELRKEKFTIQYKDSLTGYLNFEGYRQDVKRLLNENPTVKYSLWYSDIKQFKYINDVFGFDVGNQLLRYWTDYIAKSLSQGETFCRVSADNICALRRYDDVDDLKSRFTCAAEHLAAFPPLSDRKFRVEMVSGVYLMDGKEDLNLDDMINRANMAQKSVKAKPGSRIAFYSEQMRRKVLENLRFETEMFDAMSNGEFVLYFQPQIRIQSKDHPEPLRAEALVRWKRGDTLYAMPGEFIEIFENNGTIVDLDHHVFELVCQYLVKLGSMGCPELKVAVNVSRISMLQPNFVESYCDIKDRYGIADDVIELEFTENLAVRNMKRFESVVRELKARGFMCALDDFGTGQSSLSVLRSLPMDVLKLDRLFFEDTGSESQGDIVITHVLRLANDLGMKTVAEGIESEEQVDVLKSRGCDYIQGFVFARPMPEDKFTSMICEYGHDCCSPINSED